MNKQLSSKTGLVLLAVVFVAFIAVVNLAFSGWRADFTQDKLYTLSAGTQRVLKSIDEPIHLYFFFSDEASKSAPQLRSYAQQVRELLQEYVSLSGGKLQLTIIDPEPFSEEEDRADSFGLHPADVGNGQKIYFGLAGTNSTDGQDSIPFFQFDKEQTLEYDLSRLVYRLNQLKKPTIGLISSLPATGGMDMATRQPRRPWLAIEQAQQEFNLKPLAANVDSISSDINVLMLLHPKNLTRKTQFAIDQFVLRGGHLMVFVDPLAESAIPPRGAMAKNHFPGAQSSNLKTLLKAWGLSLDTTKIVADSLYGLEIMRRNNTRVRHFGIIGLHKQALNSGDVITQGLANLNLSSVGDLVIAKDHPGKIEVLLHSSKEAMLIDTTRMQMLRNPMDLMKNFKPTGKEYNLAVRISGNLKTAFPNGLTGITVEHGAAPIKGKSKVSDKSKKATAAAKILKVSSQPANIIVVADTDILTDRMWVQFRNFFGKRVANPWAGNGAFLINALDNLSGSNDLIAVRSRGRHQRPFERVQALRVAAEARFRAKQKELQTRLRQTEVQLSQLQQSKSKGQALVASPEQKAAIKRFEKQKLKIRKELRRVQHQLDRDIVGLGSELKLLNIVVIPLLLTGLLLLLVRIRRRTGH